LTTFYSIVFYFFHKIAFFNVFYYWDQLFFYIYGFHRGANSSSTEGANGGAAKGVSPSPTE